MTKHAYFDVSIGNSVIGRLPLVLYDASVPITVENFCQLIQRGSYQNCPFHRIIPGFMAQGGDYTKGNGTGGEAAAGKEFADENFLHSHTKRGILSMANAGPNTNGSQFFVCFRATPHLNKKHVVFGHIHLTEEAERVLSAMENVSTNSKDVPKIKVRISDCGVVEETSPEQKTKTEATVSTKDADEIDLDDDEDEDEDETDDPVPQNKQSENIVSGLATNVDVTSADASVVVYDDAAEAKAPTTKKQAMLNRMRLLKQKMNQARQLNHREVEREGERFADPAGERRRLHKQEKQRKQEQLERHHAKALEVSSGNGGTTVVMLEQASTSIAKSRRKAERAEAAEFSPQDYHNPQGQHRNYLRSLKLSGVPKQHGGGGGGGGGSPSTSTYNPLEIATTSSSEKQQQQGAKRLADALRKRADISNKRRRKEQVEFDQTDRNYINERNKRFNQKISRNYKEATADIKASLERGTAL